MDILRALNGFDPKPRQAALAECASCFDSFNMHCHSFYSYNGYGYSPEMIAALAAMFRWKGVGLVDFDVLDAADEFLAAAKRFDLNAVAGMETRVFVPEQAADVISSPGEPGITYHLGYGFASSQVPERARLFAAELRRKANERTAGILERVNAVLSEIALDFPEVARAFTPRGNVTERHLCAAYRARAEERFPDPGERAAYWTGKLGKFESDPVKLEALIRAKTMKKGGAGYVDPKPENFPTLREMNDFVTACGAVPTLAWLNGLSSGESDPDRLLDLHLSYGTRAVTIIPDRNWRTGDPEQKAKLLGALDRFLKACAKRDLPVLAGTELNAPGQLLCDDYTIPELRPYREQFLAGAAAAAKFTRR
ncbi:MAG: PHP domain-containing protein [Lentisphaeria bacterium]|nr:PHP domain-containing protein [Lentisphaeria bacterium]